MKGSKNTWFQGVRIQRKAPLKKKGPKCGKKGCRRWGVLRYKKKSAGGGGPQHPEGKGGGGKTDWGQEIRNVESQSVEVNREKRTTRWSEKNSRGTSTSSFKGLYRRLTVNLVRVQSGKGRPNRRQKV